MSRRVGRRDFLSQAAMAGLAAGLGSTPVGTIPFSPHRLGDPWSPPAADDADAAVFAAARKQFLFPTTVTYCNTGTLGASPRAVVAALTAARA